VTSEEQLLALFGELESWVDARAWPVRTVRYGDHPDHEADLRLPPGSGPHPTAVVIHGGFWRSRYTRTNSAAVAVALAQAGWATWNLEYRRVGSGGGFPQTLDDVAAGCDALRHLDARLDRARTIAIGHSAGGHLALWLASTGRIDAAVSLAGVCNLAAAARDGLGNGAALEFLGGSPSAVPAAYRAADPASLVPLGVPQLLVHGTEDGTVPISQARAHRERARAAGDAVDLLELDGVGHFEVIDPRSTAWPRIVEAVARFADRG
jgi:acetyl esterase/lipase